MSDPYFQTQFAQRIGGVNYGKGTEIYKFEKIKRAKRKALADYPERGLVDFGIGENDSMADESIRRRMAEEINKPENRGYMDNGPAVFKEAAANFMKRRFGVTLDPVTQVNHCIGSKPALAMLPMCFIDPGDITLMTVPGYPVAGTYTRYCGGSVFRLPLLAENNFLPDLKSIPADVLAKSKLLVLNYPNSPTGKVAPREFYEQVIAFALKHKIVVVQDAAHGMLTFQGEPTSLCFVCGHAKIVQAFADVKDNSDSGQFGAIQKSAAQALDDDSIPNRVREKYRRRLQKLVKMLQGCGFEANMPGGTYSLYVRSPKGIQGGPSFENAEAASQWLITQKSIVTVPWDDAGAFLRFSVTYEAANETAEDSLMQEAERRLRESMLQF